MRSTISHVQRSLFERDDIRVFDFGSIPADVEVVRQGVRLRLHPTLVDRGHCVSADLVADPGAAERGLLAGYVRLWSLALAAPFRHAEKQILADRELMLLHQGVGTAQGLARDIATRAVLRECCPAGSALPRSQAEFEAYQRRGQANLVAAAEKLAAQLRLVLSDYRAARQEIARLPDGCDAALVTDLSAQLGQLVYEGFVAQTPEPWLDGFGRYLKALRRRLAKLPGMRGAVADAQYDYLAARQRYADAGKRLAHLGLDPQHLLEWRWHLEEYAVQLFAQDLRTRVPISAKRLAALEASAISHLTRL